MPGDKVGPVPTKGWRLPPARLVEGSHGEAGRLDHVPQAQDQAGVPVRFPGPSGHLTVTPRLACLFP